MTDVSPVIHIVDEQKFQIQSLAKLALIAERLGLLSIAQSAKEWRDPARL
jgi:hypothetical protein